MRLCDSLSWSAHASSSMYPNIRQDGGSIRGQKPQDQLIQPQSWTVVARKRHLVDRVIHRKFVDFLKLSLSNGNAKPVAILLASLLQ